MIRTGMRRGATLGAVLLAGAALLPGAPAAQTAQTAPPLAAPRPYTFARPVERTLPNGLRVVVAEQHDVPMVAAQLVVRTGAEADPEGLPGLADFTATLVPRGTQSRPGPQLTQALTSQGGQMLAASDWDFSRVTALATASRFPAVAEIFAESVLRPALAAQDVQSFNRLAAQRAQNRFNQPLTLAEYAAARLVYGGIAYGHPAVGTPESVARITRDDVVRFHQTYYRPDNAVLVFTGDIRPDAAFALAERLFGGWARPSVALPAPAAVQPAPLKETAILVDVPEMEGASMVVVRPGVGLGDPDYFRALMSNALLGGGWTSRLGRRLRIERPLAQSLRTWVDARRGGGLLFASASTGRASAAEVASLLAGGLGSLSTGMAADSELVVRRGFVMAQLARELQTVDGLANQVGMLAARGVALDRLARYGQELQGVGAADVQRFAGARREGARVVVVGDAKSLQEELRKRFPELVVIPSSELDLGSANLRRGVEGN